MKCSGSKEWKVWGVKGKGTQVRTLTPPSHSSAFYKWQPFSAFYLTSSPEYPYFGPFRYSEAWDIIQLEDHFFARVLGRKYLPCNTSRLEPRCDGTISGWKHDINCNGLKNLPVYRATVTAVKS